MLYETKPICTGRMITGVKERLRKVVGQMFAWIKTSNTCNQNECIGIFWAKRSPCCQY